MVLCHILLLHCSSRQKQQHSKILNEQVNGKGNALEMRRVIYMLVKCREINPKLATLNLKCRDGNI